MLNKTFEVCFASTVSRDMSFDRLEVLRKMKGNGQGRITKSYFSVHLINIASCIVPIPRAVDLRFCLQTHDWKRQASRVLTELNCLTNLEI